LHSFETRRVNIAMMYILYVLKLKLWLRSDSVYMSSSLRHSHCLATIAFILDICLWWHVLWRFNHNYVVP